MKSITSLLALAAATIGFSAIVHADEIQYTFNYDPASTNLQIIGPNFNGDRRDFDNTLTSVQYRNWTTITQKARYKKVLVRDDGYYKDVEVQVDPTYGESWNGYMYLDETNLITGEKLWRTRTRLGRDEKLAMIHELIRGVGPATAPWVVDRLEYKPRNWSEFCHFIESVERYMVDNGAGHGITKRVLEQFGEENKANLYGRTYVRHDFISVPVYEDVLDGYDPVSEAHREATGATLQKRFLVHVSGLTLLEGESNQLHIEFDGATNRGGVEVQSDNNQCSITKQNDSAAVYEATINCARIRSVPQNSLSVQATAEGNELVLIVTDSQFNSANMHSIGDSSIEITVLRDVWYKSEKSETRLVQSKEFPLSTISAQTKIHTGVQVNPSWKAVSLYQVIRRHSVVFSEVPSEQKKTEKQKL